MHDVLKPLPDGKGAQSSLTQRFPHPPLFCPPYFLGCLPDHHRDFFRSFVHLLFKYSNILDQSTALYPCRSAEFPRSPLPPLPPPWALPPCALAEYSLNIRAPIQSSAVTSFWTLTFRSSLSSLRPPPAQYTPMLFIAPISNSPVQTYFAELFITNCLLL